MFAEGHGHGRAESGPTCSSTHDVALFLGRLLHLGTQALTAGYPCPQGLTEVEVIPASF